MTMRPNTFRLLLAGLAAGIAGPAIAQSCVQASERTAFDVRALQSQLMVAALACGRDADYNAFVRKFQGDLGRSYHTIAGHFRRTSGAAGQRELDAYITTLANAQSQDSIRQGSFYCPQVAPLFPLALAQSNAQGLAELAADRNVLNPLATQACTSAQASASPAARSSTRR